MPQKWLCRCGQNVPIQMTFCGACGTKWTKVSKQTQSNPKSTPVAPKAKPSKEPDVDSTEFPIPDVGISLELSSGASLASAPLQTERQMPQNKSIPSQLHQRANRAGKIEARIQKLTAALTQLETSWPQYVNRMHSKMTHAHQKCTMFHAKVQQELRALQQEHQDLLTRQLEMPTLATEAQHVTKNVGNQPAVSAAQVQLALQVLQSVGIATQPTYAVDVPVQVPMEAANVGMTAMPPILPTFSVEHPNLIEPPNVDHMDLDLGLLSPVGVPSPLLPLHSQQDMSNMPMSAPPGVWDWPPPVPQVPNVLSQAFQVDSQVQATQTVAVDTSTQPPEFMPASTDRIDPLLPYMQLDPATQKAVNEAAAALQALPTAQGGAGGNVLTAAHQEKLRKFAEQQQQCQQQMTDLLQPGKHSDEAAKSVSTPPRATRTGHASHKDSVSIASSPDQTKSAKSAPAQYLLSPGASRPPKVPKVNTGAVHDQATAGLTAETIPISPSSSRSATPVPTEIASEGSNGQDAVQELD